MAVEMVTVVVVVWFRNGFVVWWFAAARVVVPVVLPRTSLVSVAVEVAKGVGEQVEAVVLGRRVGSLSWRFGKVLECLGDDSEL